MKRSHKVAPVDKAHAELQHVSGVSWRGRHGVPVVGKGRPV